MEYVQGFVTRYIFSTVTNQIKPRFLDLIIKNLIWNIFFLLIVIFDINIYSINLLLLYYLVVYGLLVFGISKVIMKMDNTTLISLLPNMIRKFKLYLYFLTTIFIVDFINAVYELKLDIPIYTFLCLVTLYFIRLENLKTIYKISDLLITSEPKLKLYLAYYIGSNVLTSLICMLIYNYRKN